MLQGDRKWAIICYIPIFNIVTCPLTAVRKANNPFCRFHHRQGLALFGLWFLTVFVALISQTLSLMLWGIVLLLHGAGVYFAIKGTTGRIPIIVDFAEKIPEYYFFTLLTGKNPDVLTPDLPPSSPPDVPQSK